MAQEVPINPGLAVPIAKIRHPVLVVVWSVLTLGIYSIYWWYQTNREVADLGRVRGEPGMGDNPTLSLLAWFPGALILVPYYVSLYNGCKRFQRAQEVTVREVTFNGWIVLILLLLAFVLVFPGLLVPGYIQSELNKVWEDVESGGELTSGVAETPATGIAPAEGGAQQQPQPPSEPPAPQA
ncbi:MAG TPA: DUF4234 domain-containing protein [Solirubrobacterales bacterium]